MAAEVTLTGRPATVFRASLPLLVTGFINKVGAIGLSLLPMVLVERAASTAESSVVMGLVKAALVAGTFLGGWACDRAGMKATLVFSFVLSGVGLGLLPWAPGLLALGALATLSQLGQAMFQAPSRFLATRLVGLEHQQEVMGWLRTALNSGQIVCFAIGALFAGSGTLVLMLFDAFTSLAAAGVGMRVLPSEGEVEVSRRVTGEMLAQASDGLPQPSWSLFLLAAFSNFGFSFLFDLFQVTAAARFKILFADDGLRVFSQVMIINTLLCTVFAVVAARTLRRPHVVFPVGIALAASGTLLVSSADARPLIYLGAFVLTLGEIVYAALSQFVMMRVTPPSKRQGSLYSFALVIQSVGRILGSAVAFPLVVHGARPAVAVGAFGVAFVGVSLAAARPLKAHFGD